MLRVVEVRRDPDHPSVCFKKVVVRDVETPDLGISEVNWADQHVETDGIGFLLSEAFDEIEERLELEEYVGEHVASVFVDAESWEYAIEWQVEVPLVQRIRRLLLPSGGEADDA